MSIHIDFSDPDFIRKCKSKPTDLTLLKAVGLTKRKDLTILDTCAGRGQDAALMAVFSGEVLALERHPEMFAALEQAVSKISERKPWKQRLQIQQQDALTYLANLEPADYPDVIYIDPMYPHHNKNPRNKLILQQMRNVVGDDTDADQLLELAWGKAIERIVVKRPKRAPLLGGKEPSYQCKGNSTRFDVYLASLF